MSPSFKSTFSRYFPRKRLQTLWKKMEEKMQHILDRLSITQLIWMASSSSGGGHRWPIKFDEVTGFSEEYRSGYDTYSRPATCLRYETCSRIAA